MATSSSAQRSLHTHEILDRTAVWNFRNENRGIRDFERACIDNAAIAFRRRGTDLSFCVLISSGGSHLAAIEGDPSANTIKVTVYHLNGDFEEKWSTTHIIDGDLGAPQRLSLYDSATMHGGVTEDGESVLVVYRPAGRVTKVYTVTTHGFTPRRPPSETASGYLTSSGDMSDDSEYIFYSRRGNKFGSGGEAKAVEAFSVRNLARLKAVTFAFGDGHHLRNVRLLRPLQLRGPVYMAVDTSGFRDDDYDLNGPMLVASSDGKLHWHASGLNPIISIGAKSNASISPDGAHMFYVQKDDAILHQWALKKPTLQPIGSVRLPGVEYGQSRRWIIHGQETTIRDAVAEQLYHIRYSPGCNVVTVVTANNSTVIINVFLASNLQIIYHQKIQHTTWPGLKPLHIGFNDSTGLTVVGMSPTLSLNNPNRPSMTVGVMGVMLPLKDVFEKIKKIEEYFDSISSRITTLLKSVEIRQCTPECRFSWRPGVFDRNDAAAIVHEQGRVPLATAEDLRRQREFYESVFAPPSSSVKMPSTPEIRHFMVPLLFSFKYPWDPDQTVSIFGVVMKNEYHIIAIGPSPSSLGKSPDVIRALYATDIKVASEIKERIEIYKSECNYILHVSQEQGHSGAYSGAPMPLPRSTIASPHFLEEDAWYDIFIIHRAAHVTMPTGWSTTPNLALMSTANIHAYFEPRTFTVMDVVDYGHRANSSYIRPKYLLWQEYGLRGFRNARLNDVFFGGGRYADAIGPYLRSIYDDRTYDDSNPLFPSIFALVCNIGHRSRATKHVDAFFRRLHQDNQRLLANTQSVSYTLPLACRARPIASLSFMQHIVLFPHKINDIGIVEAKNGASSKVYEAQYDSRWHQMRLLLSNIWSALTPYWSSPNEVQPEPNTSRVTLPLQGFCSFNNRLYRAPPVSTRDDSFWEIVRATTPASGDVFLPWETQILNRVAYSSKGPASPFTRLVEEILDMKDREVQLSFLGVVWLEKLLSWKMKTFGLHVYLTRTVLPIVLLFGVHLAVGILSTENNDQNTRGIRVIIIFLACIEALLSCYILSTKARQLFRVPRLFFRSIPNYIEMIALSLGIALFFMVVSKNHPSRAFLAFSTLLIWVAAILMLRIYRPIGMLLLLLTETMQEVFSFLALLFFIILGFAFVPFLLLRNLSSESASPNLFSSFPLTISQMLNFIASDYSALEPFEPSLASVRTLKALYIIIITILFLNALVAILNLKMKRADKNAANLYHLQMASMQVEIELALLSSSERARRDWFPEWFSYTMTETEKRVWMEFVEKHPLKWTEENDFNEDKDHAPLVNLDDNTSSQQATTSATKSGGAATNAQTGAQSTSGSTTTGSQPKQSDAARPAEEPATASPRTSEPAPLIIHHGKPTTDLLSALEPLDESQFPLDDGSDFFGELDEGWWEPSDAGGNGEGSSSSQAGPLAQAQTSTSNTTQCTVCSQPGQPCGKCGKVAYCGEAHRRQDAKAHGIKCVPATRTTPGQEQAQAAAATEEIIELAEPLCVLCGAPGKRCLGCQKVAYCTQTHQKADWKRHKSECKGKGKAKAGGKP